MGRDPAEQRPGLRRPPGPGEQRRRRGRGEAEAQQPNRMARDVQDRLHDVLEQLPEVRRGRAEDTPPGRPVLPQPTRRLLDRAHHHARAPVVQRMRQVDLRPQPLQPVPLQVQRAQEGRADRHRVGGRAVIVEQPGHGQLAGPRAATDPVLGLEHRHLDAIARQLHRGGEPIGPRADDDRLAQGLAEYPGDFVPPTGRDSSRATAPPSTTTGKSKDSSSHGWLVTMSFTAIVPSSSRPSTASQISKC